MEEESIFPFIESIARDYDMEFEVVLKYYLRHTSTNEFYEELENYIKSE